MPRLPRRTGLWDSLMASGEYPGETDVQRGMRRIVVGYIIFGIPSRLVFGTATIAEGLTATGMVDLIAALVPAVIRDKFVCKPRGTIFVKGKGEMQTYILHSKRAATSEPLLAVDPA